MRALQIPNFRKLPCSAASSTNGRVAGRRLRLEPLENRRLLSVGFSQALDDTLLPLVLDSALESSVPLLTATPSPEPSAEYFATLDRPEEFFRMYPMNVDAAATTRTDQLHPSGGLGLNLEGDGYMVGVWEANAMDPEDGVASYVRYTHDQLTGRVLFTNPIDCDPSTPYLSDHATHVAATIAGSGVAAPGHEQDDATPARGMAPEANILSLSSKNDLAEMRAVAQYIQVSNHSYGADLGWRVWDVDALNDLLEKSFSVSSSENVIDVWQTVWGEDVEDEMFGKYTTEAAGLDDVLYDKPYLLSVWSAGNDRDDEFTDASEDNTYVTLLSTDPWGGQNPEWTGPDWYLVDNDEDTPAPESDGNLGTGFDSLAPSSTVLDLSFVYVQWR